MKNFEQQQLHKEKAKEHEEIDISKRPERAEKIIKFLDKINAFEFFENIDQQREKISFEDFKSFLVRLNGLVKDIPIKQRKFNGENVEISGGLLGEIILPPKEEDKTELLEFAFNSAKDLSRGDNAYMIPVVVNALHMFNDGNGRTSRVIHLLLVSENKESFNLELEKALGAEGRFHSYDINPALVDSEIREKVLENHGWEFFTNEKGYRRGGSEKIKGRIAPSQKGINFEDKKFFSNLQKYDKLASADLEYVLTATTEALSSEQYDQLLIDHKQIFPAKMQTLSDVDWKMIFNCYFKLKKEHIETLVWIFKDPNTYKNPKNENETLKDLFIRRTKEEHESNNPQK